MVPQTDVTMARAELSQIHRYASQLRQIRSSAVATLFVRPSYDTPMVTRSGWETSPVEAVVINRLCAPHTVYLEQIVRCAAHLYDSATPKEQQQLRVLWTGGHIDELYMDSFARRYAALKDPTGPSTTSDEPASSGLGAYNTTSDLDVSSSNSTSVIFTAPYADPSCSVC
jgi:hypothetical protein